MGKYEYNEDKMRRFKERDRYVAKMVEGLVDRGIAESHALQVVFNTMEVDNDTVMLEAYQKS